MRVIIEIEIESCLDCPFRGSTYEQGGCWEQCNHKEHNQAAYGNILFGCGNDFNEVPDWCPLGINSSK